MTRLPKEQKEKIVQRIRELKLEGLSDKEIMKIINVAEHLMLCIKTIGYYGQLAFSPENNAKLDKENAKMKQWTEGTPKPLNKEEQYAEDLFNLMKAPAINDEFVAKYDNFGNYDEEE